MSELACPTQQTTSDATTRKQALSHHQSFIVQAPAGSGKTELLIQRYMIALTHATYTPEQVVAITFTKKAAQEMKTRVLEALITAYEPKKTAHAQHTAHIAQALLKRSETAGWQIQAQPHRLHIMTFDAWASHLVKQGQGAHHVPQTIADTPDVYYQQAALAVMTPQENATVQTAQTTVLSHLNNRLNHWINLCSEMLAKRDQWLGHVMHHQAPEALASLEDATRNILCHYLHKAKAAWPGDLWAEAMALWAYQCRQQNLELPEPSEDPETQAAWQHFAKSWLTQQHSWRQSVTKNQGFPAPSGLKNPFEKEEAAAYKQRRQACLEHLKTNEDIRQTLSHVLYTPNPNDLKNNALLRALLTLLPRLAAQLRVIMQQAGCCDFIDMTAEALRALTTTEEARGPLALEQRLEHLLVDEFQDTSIQQYRLLQAATEAWTEDDGHSLFLVGDPMQSIYRFRQADVALFLHVQQAGLGAIRPKTLTLKANYRSKPEVLDWINQTFATIMPKQADLNRSAIPYTRAITPEHQTNQSPGTVQCHSLDDASLLAETVCALVQRHQAHNPDHSIGLLGATRQHVMPIMQALNTAGIPYHAKEMLSLHDNISVRDMHCLTHLCCTPDDRIHQLGLLRTPWVGLSLQDIECIQQASKTTTILDFSTQGKLPSTLSSEGSETLKTIMPILAYFLTQRAGQALSTWVRTFCRALGGIPQDDIAPVTAYLALLEQHDGPSFDLKVFEAQLKTRYYSQTPTCESTIHVMTMHQSKGLAFDCVILPALEKTGRSDTTPLMQCATMLTETGQHVVLSPMPAPGMPTNQTQLFLAQRNREQTQHEKKRLLYVAATRARHALHLLATPPSAKDKAPSQGSLLHHLWPAIHNEMVNPDAQASEASTNPPSQTPEVRESEKAEVLHHVAIQRTLRPITMPSPLPYRQHQIQAKTQPKSPQQYAGDLMHAMMQHAADPNRLLDLTNDAAALRYASRYMRRMPVDAEMQQTVVTACLQMREQILAHPRATWLLSDHPQAASEYVMERLVDGQRCTQIIDRCFWDEQSERFWIVDYKTHALQAGESIDTFAKRLRTQHQATMEAYVDTFAIRHPNKPIQWGLYALQANLWITKNAHA